MPGAQCGLMTAKVQPNSVAGGKSASAARLAAEPVADLAPGPQVSHPLGAGAAQRANEDASIEDRRHQRHPPGAAALCPGRLEDDHAARKEAGAATAGHDHGLHEGVQRAEELRLPPSGASGARVAHRGGTPRVGKRGCRQPIVSGLYRRRAGTSSSSGHPGTGRRCRGKERATWTREKTRATGRARGARSSSLPGMPPRADLRGRASTAPG